MESAICSLVIFAVVLSVGPVGAWASDETIITSDPAVVEVYAAAGTVAWLTGGYTWPLPTANAVVLPGGASLDRSWTGPQAYDVDLGIDAYGFTVLTYARCEFPIGCSWHSHAANAWNAPDQRLSPPTRRGCLTLAVALWRATTASVLGCPRATVVLARTGRRVQVVNVGGIGQFFTFDLAGDRVVIWGRVSEYTGVARVARFGARPCHADLFSLTDEPGNLEPNLTWSIAPAISTTRVAWGSAILGHGTDEQRLTVARLGPACSLHAIRTIVTRTPAGQRQATLALDGPWLCVAHGVTPGVVRLPADG